MTIARSLPDMFQLKMDDFTVGVFSSCLSSEKEVLRDQLKKSNSLLYNDLAFVSYSKMERPLHHL